MKTQLFAVLFVCTTFSLPADYDSQAYPYTNNRAIRSTYNDSDNYYSPNSRYSSQNNDASQYGYGNYNDAYPYHNYRQSASSGSYNQQGNRNSSNGQSSDQYYNPYQDQYPYHNYRESANQYRGRGYADQNTPGQNTMFQRNEHMGDWDFKENWRYDRAAYLHGETEPQAYRESHRNGANRIGYDDPNTP